MDELKAVFLMQEIQYLLYKFKKGCATLYEARRDICFDGIIYDDNNGNRVVHEKSLLGFEPELIYYDQEMFNGEFTVKCNASYYDEETFNMYRRNGYCTISIIHDGKEVVEITDREYSIKSPYHK